MLGFSDGSELTQLTLPNMKEGRITSAAKAEENSNSTDSGRLVVIRGDRYLFPTKKANFAPKWPRSAHEFLSLVE